MSNSISESIRLTLSRTPPFDLLDGNVLESLLGDTSVEQFDAGDIIMQQGDRSHRGLFIVERGLVRVMDAELDRLIDLCGTSDYFGAFGLIRGGAHIYQARAVEPTVCILLEAQRFMQVYRDHPDVAAYFDGDLKMYVRRMGSEQDVTGGRRLFAQRLNQFTYPEPVSVDPDTTAEEAARLMTRRGARALLVSGPRQLRGIVSDRSLRQRLLARGRPYDTPVGKLTDTAFVQVDANVTLFEAMMTMLETSARWLVVRGADSDGPLGVLTDRDLAHLRGQDPLATSRRIESATSVDHLLEARGTVDELLTRLYRQGTSPEEVGRIMAVLTDRLMTRVIRLVEEQLKKEHAHERVDLPWAWVRLGSGGRKEAVLTSHQHNALVYADPADDDEAERAAQWFNRLAAGVNDALERCGFQPSEVVARDERWRGSLRTWRRTYRQWILASSDDELAPAPLFFDLRGLYGDLSLVDALKETVEDALNVQAMDPDRRVLTLLAQNAVQERPPLSIFKRFLLERSGDFRSQVDIRRRGVLPVVDALRVLALDVRYLASSNTFDRLRHVAEALPEMAPTLMETREAYQYLLDFRLERQLRDVELGEAPVSYLDPSQLTKLQQNVLRNAFTAVTALQRAVIERYDLKQSLRDSIRELGR